MGGFYGSFHVRTDDRDAVIETLNRFLKRRPQQFLVGPTINGWVGLYPDDSGQDDRVSRALAKIIQFPILHVAVHDDDIFCYSLYREGKLVDEFNSCPEYFGEKVTERKRQKLRGQPELLAEFLNDKAALEGLRSLLSRPSTEQPVFLVETLTEFANLVGLPNAVASYEYLQCGETDHIERWDEFIHVPDQSDEKVRQRQRAREIEVTKQRLKADGVLLVDQAGHVPEKGVFGMSRPDTCPSGDGGFLVAWSSHSQEPGEQSLQHYRGPSFQQIDSLSIRLASNIHKMSSSSSGRLLGVGYAAGNWSVEIWDIPNCRRLMQGPIRRAADWIGFSPDEASFVVSSESEITVFDTASGEVRCKFETNSGTPSAIAIHPSGTILIGDAQARLVLWELSTGRRLKSLCMGDPTMATETIQMALDKAVAFAEGTLANKDWEQKERTAFEASLNTHKQQFEKLSSSKKFAAVAMTWDTFKAQAQQNFETGIAKRRQEMEQLVRNRTVESRHIVAPGTLKATCLATSQCGTWIGSGLENGAAVFEWQAIEAAADQAGLQPRFQFQSEPQVVSRRDRSMERPCRSYAVAFDEPHHELLVGCEDGKARTINLQSGLHGIVLDQPEALAIIKLAVSSDQNALSCIVHNFEAEKRVTALQIWNYRQLLDRRPSMVSNR